MTKDLTVEQLREIAIDRLQCVDDGGPPLPLDRALIKFAATASITSLHPAAIDQAIANAVALGATSAQLQEMISLVAGLGVHALMITESRIVAATGIAGATIETPLNEEQQSVWDKYVGHNSYWERFERYSPGFLKSMLVLSPAQFEAFFNFCSVPWRGKTVSSTTKELAAIACDSSPSHRFLPGFLFHLEMAISMGIGRRAIMETLDVAAATSVHRGTR